FWENRHGVSAPPLEVPDETRSGRTAVPADVSGGDIVAGKNWFRPRGHIVRIRANVVVRSFGKTFINVPNIRREAVPGLDGARVAFPVSGVAREPAASIDQRKFSAGFDKSSNHPVPVIFDLGIGEREGRGPQILSANMNHP